MKFLFKICVDIMRRIADGWRSVKEKMIANLCPINGGVMKNPMME
jgi:hypothetical protein